MRGQLPTTNSQPFKLLDVDFTDAQSRLAARHAPRACLARGAMSTAVRWLLVPLTAFAVWVGTLLVGIGGVSLLDSMCPPDLMVSGLCTAAWHRPAMAGLEMLCAGIAAIGFIVLPAKVAPTHRVQVAVVCFVVGGLLTSALAVAGALWWPSAVAAIAGIAALRIITNESARRR